MDYAEIDIIIEILKKKKPKACLEWGAGYSTLFFPQYITKDSNWISIEHNKEWFKKIKRLTSDDNRVEIFWVPPNCSQWTDPYEDGSFSDLKDYVEYPEKLDRKFDFILIDGRARVYCLMSALKLLEPDGVVVLHDANREYYYNGFKNYRFKQFFLDKRRDSGGVFIGSKTLDLNCILKIEKHKLEWKMIELPLRIYQIMHELSFRMSGTSFSS